jgi:arylsulfatase A-like enzyme
MRVETIVERAVIVTGLALGLVVGCGPATPPVAPTQRTAQARPDAPNVLLISLDGLRFDHMSLFGYERQTTPSIDWLGRNGTTFDTVIAPGGSTKTSLTSLLTGMDYRFHQIFDHNQRLPADFTTLGETFRDAGYLTAAVVATPMLSHTLGYDQGFLVYEDFARTPGAEDYVRATRVADRMLEILGRATSADARAPFFLYTHFEEPHPPWHAPSPWLDTPEAEQRYDKAQPFDLGCSYVPRPDELHAVTRERRAEWIAQYDGAILQADREIGRVIDFLRTRGLLERTVVAITTDHGYDLLDKYAFGHGYGVSEEIVRTFLVLYDPTRKDPWPATPPIQARTFDIGPTLLARAGIGAPTEFEGVDLLTQADRVPRFAFTIDSGVVSVRTPTHKLVYVDFAGARPKPASIPAFGFQLFDLRTDPRELADLKDRLPDTFRELRAEYDRLEQDRHREFVAGTRTPLDDETTARLRSLGYVN